jgi:hypothetical protein
MCVYVCVCVRMCTRATATLLRYTAIYVFALFEPGHVVARLHTIKHHPQSKQFPPFHIVDMLFERQCAPGCKRCRSTLMLLQCHDITPTILFLTGMLLEQPLSFVVGGTREIRWTVPASQLLVFHLSSILRMRFGVECVHDVPHARQVRMP